MRKLLVLSMVTLLAACSSVEVPQLTAGVGQQSIVRDGNPAIVSKKPASIVILKPAARGFQEGQRVGYVVAIFNPGKAPLEFKEVGVEAKQIAADEKVTELKVITFDELVQEEKNRQVMAAVLVGVAAGANAAAASRAGYYHATGTAYGPRGPSTVTVTGYSPAAASIAQSNANIQNAVMIDNAVQVGQQNMAALEQLVIKDDTILPGEWYGGRITIQPPTGDGAKKYQITIQAGPDLHIFNIEQVRKQPT